MVRGNRSRDPFQPWREEVERFFSTHFPTAGEAVRRQGEPAINLWEADGELSAEVELPGIQQADLEILVAGGELTIKAQRPTPANGSQAFHRRERASGPFQRTIRLPVDVDATKVQATLRDGVLSISLPTAEAARPRKIPVQSGN